MFLSCGQRPQELEIAESISMKLRSLGFFPYIAVKEHSLRGIKENIFTRLEESEYVIFIDFKRERLFQEKNGQFSDTRTHRGSLFSHQELAIATFLEDKEIIAFREAGVAKEDGILKYIQANCVEFSNRKDLPQLIMEKIHELDWKSDWINGLTLERESSDFQDAQVPSRGSCRFFHIKIINNHYRKTARNCIAFLESIYDVKHDTMASPELAEFKWKGTIVESVSIAPKSYRYLDALYASHYDPKDVWFGINPHIVDWEGYSQDYYRSIGEYVLTFVVYSDNFLPARAKIKLEIHDNIKDLILTKM